jgi:hypothetical protein
MVTAERPSWQAGIAVRDDDEDGDAQELEHHGDDTGGDSDHSPVQKSLIERSV